MSCIYFEHPETFAKWITWKCHLQLLKDITTGIQSNGTDSAAYYRLTALYNNNYCISLYFGQYTFFHAMINIVVFTKALAVLKKLATPVTGGILSLSYNHPIT